MPKMPKIDGILSIIYKEIRLSGKIFKKIYNYMYLVYKNNLNRNRLGTNQEMERSDTLTLGILDHFRHFRHLFYRHFRHFYTRQNSSKKRR